MPLEAANSRPGATSRKRVARLFIVATMAAIGLFQVATLRRGHEWGDDFAMYLLLARNLAEGHPYADTGYVYNPDYPSIGPTTLPPVFPAQLAGLYQVCGLDFDLLKLIEVASLLVVLAVIAIAPGGRLPLSFRVAFLFMVGLHPYYTEQKNALLSDIPCLVWIYLALGVVDHADRRARALSTRCLCMAVAAGLAYLAYATRSAALMVFPSVMLFDLLKRRRLTAPAMVFGGVFVACAAAQAMWFHSDTAYAGQMNPNLSVVLNNFHFYSGRMAAYLHNGYSKPAGAALTLVLTLIAIYGYAWECRHRFSVYAVFPWLYMIPVMLWRSPVGETRFLLPIFPLFAYYLMLGVVRAPWLAVGRRRDLALVALAISVGLSYAGRYATQPRGDFVEGVTNDQAKELFANVTALVPRDATVVFAKPRAMSLLARRNAVASHRHADDASFERFLRKFDARYVVVFRRPEAVLLGPEPDANAFLRDYAARHPESLKRLWENRDFELYEAAPTASPAG